MKLGDFDLQQDESFAVDSVTKLFLQLWRKEKQATLSLECKDGRASVNLSVSLGTSTREKMNSMPSSPVPPSSRKSRTRSSPSKLRRNRARAQEYHEKKRSELEKIRLGKVPIVPELNKSQENVSDKNNIANVSIARDYQLCFMDDDVFDDDAETADDGVINLEDGCDNGIKPLEEDAGVVTSDQQKLEPNFSEQCTGGPTVHCQHEEEVYYDEDHHSEQSSTERMIMFDEMAGGGGCAQEEPFITDWDISYVYNLYQDSAFRDGCCCRNWSYHDFEKYYVKHCPDCCTLLGRVGEVLLGSGVFMCILNQEDLKVKRSLYVRLWMHIQSLTGYAT